MTRNVESEGSEEHCLPEQGDYVISSVGPLGVVTQVTYFDDGHLGSYSGGKEAEEAIRRDMENTGVHANVWWLRDGGYRLSSVTHPEDDHRTDAEESEGVLDFHDRGEIRVRITDTHLVTGFGQGGVNEEWPLKDIYGMRDGRLPTGEYSLTVRMQSGEGPVVTFSSPRTVWLLRQALEDNM